MGNTWFQFKNFIIHQDKCAMKVTTDACLFGAWCANDITNFPYIKYALDIGTGTGLLSLMIAQKNSFKIDAVEIDTDAATQAAVNFEKSNYSSQINIIHTDILRFSESRKYDYIFSNPPFYEYQLQSPVAAKNKAHHDSGLQLHQLLQFIQLNLTDSGIAHLLLPFYRKEELVATCRQYTLYIGNIVTVKPVDNKPAFRIFVSLQRNNQFPFSEEELVIKTSNNQYSQSAQQLLSGYYLHL